MLYTNLCKVKKENYLKMIINKKDIYLNLKKELKKKTLCLMKPNNKKYFSQK